MAMSPGVICVLHFAETQAIGNSQQYILMIFNFMIIRTTVCEDAI